MEVEAAKKTQAAIERIEKALGLAPEGEDGPDADPKAVAARSAATLQPSQVEAKLDRVIELLETLHKASPAGQFEAIKKNAVESAPPSKPAQAKGDAGKADTPKS